MSLNALWNTLRCYRIERERKKWIKINKQIKKSHTWNSTWSRYTYNICYSNIASDTASKCVFLLLLWISHWYIYLSCNLHSNNQNMHCLLSMRGEKNNRQAISVMEFHASLVTDEYKFYRTKCQYYFHFILIYLL